MKYLINELAKLAGVSARTLRYYDEIGLLKPSGTMPNGYRYYEKAELLRLQQILFYRELDMPLDDIRDILDRPDFDIRQALRDHKFQLNKQRERYDRMILTINKTIKYMAKQSKIDDRELYDPFRDKAARQYQSEVKLRWGKSETYKQSMARVKKLTKTEMENMKNDSQALTQEIAAGMDKGPADTAVQELIARHYKGMCFFYDCPLEMYRNLGKMYVNDRRFAAHYEKFRPGLAVFMRDAIAVFCDTKK